MKTLMKSIVSAAVLFAATSYAVADEMGTMRTEAGTVKWLEAGFGPLISPVVGDPGKGPHMTMVKFAPGFKTPVHIHSHDYTGVVVQGQWKHYEPGKPETETVLSAGATWTVKGNVNHISECISKEECISVVYQTEAFDYKPVN